MLIVAFYFIYKTDLTGIQNDLINENTDPMEKFESLNCSSCENDDKYLLNK